MVSQRVSQKSKNTPKNDENGRFEFLEIATACPSFLGSASAKINGSDCEEKASTCETHGPHCLRSRSSGAGIAAETDGVSDKTTNSHNSQALRQDAKEFDDRQFRFGSSANASTVQIPSSSEEVSAMPKKGNGCIYKTKTKSGKQVWKVEAIVGYRIDGQRIRTRRTAHSYAEALKISRQLQADAHRGQLRTKATEKFSDYALWWVRTVVTNRVKPSTASDYEYRLRHNVIPYFGNRLLTEISSRDVETWMAKLHANNLSTATINGARQTLGAVLKYAVRQEVIYKNPVDLTDRFTRNVDSRTSVKAPWSIHEARQVLVESKGTEFELFAVLALNLGLRRGEILGLKWSDFDFERGTVSIRRTLKQVRAFDSEGHTSVRLNLDTPKTNRSVRTLAIGTPVLVAIQTQKLYNVELQRSKADHWPQSEHVFLSQSCSLQIPNNFVKKWQKFLSSRGIRRIRVHDMRHTTATLSLEAGARLEAVTQALGHSRTDTTKTIYAPYVQVLADEMTSVMAEYLIPNIDIFQKEGSKSNV